ncbi:MAG: RidA family protein [Myxococcales bacterium]|nr:RidA family protein [Myxococcales bacterium]
MSKRVVVKTKDAPGAIGPYSQAMCAGGMVFCSGQVALNPATGAIVEGGVGEQTAQVLKNLRAVLEAGGAGLDSVVKTTIFLADMDDFAAVNAVYAEAFGESRPARATVQVSRLPLDVLVEIDAIAMQKAGAKT